MQTAKTSGQCKTLVFEISAIRENTRLIARCPSQAPGQPKLIPTLHRNHINFHRKHMSAKQVLRQVNFVPTFADFWDDYMFQEVRENAAGDTIR